MACCLVQFWRKLTFTNVVLAMFAIYCLVTIHSIAGLFFPVRHHGSPEGGHAPVWEPSTTLFDLYVYLSRSSTASSAAKENNLVHTARAISFTHSFAKKLTVFPHYYV